MMTLQRFAAPILSSIAAFVFITIDLHHETPVIQKQFEFMWIKLFMECLMGIPLFTAFTIFSEKFNLSRSSQWGLLLLGSCILGLHYYSVPVRLFDNSSIFLARYFLFFVTFHLLVSIVAFQQITEIKSFWQYNQFLFINFFTSCFFSLSLTLGLEGALLAVDKLFGFDISGKYYFDIATFILVVFNTLFFFQNMPARFESFKEAQEYKRWMRLFVQHVLIPILLIYMVILYAYLFKIVMYRYLPVGWVCRPILIFSSLGILAYLLVYPIRMLREYRVIHFFSRYFFYLLLPLISLYFISILNRIKEYGVTENRYLALLLGLSILVICIYAILSRIDNIITIPVGLIIILFLGAIGPWGMFQFSVRNQVNRLERNLKRNHLLHKGKLVSIPKGKKVSKEDARSIHSILEYLNRRDAINVIYPWLNEREQQQLRLAMERGDTWSLNAIFSLGKSKAAIETDEHLYTLHCLEEEEQNQLLDINGYRHMVTFSTKEISVFSDNHDDQAIQAFVQNNELIFSKAHDTLLRYKASSFLPSFFKKENHVRAKNLSQPMISVMDIYNKDMELPQDSLVWKNDSSKVCFQHLRVYRKDSVFQLQQADGYLLLKK